MNLERNLPSYYQLSPEVLRARLSGLPMVALESTVITHGLPYQENLNLARDMETEVRGLGAVPATIAVLAGKVCIGLNDLQLEQLASGKNLAKISARDFGPVLAKGGSGGTTVAGTLWAAYPVGIKVFATGGIGGVHRPAPGERRPSYDISADLEMLSRRQMVVVCAGAKAILDLPATLEMLETLSVPVIGYQTDEFPAFYSRSSGLKTSARVNDPEEAADMARCHWEMGMESALLVTVPPPEDYALKSEEVEAAIRQAIGEIRDKKITGQQVTPFLLDKVRALTGGESLKVNLSLLVNNARIAAQIARYLVPPGRQARA
jgi:pseudouridylate synthase